MLNEYKPIKNEAYPWITILIFTTFLMVIMFLELWRSLWFLAPALLFVAVNIALAVYITGIILAYIRTYDEKIEIFYKGVKWDIRWKDILDVREAYPDKKVFARRIELYEIRVITITSSENKDFMFHYIMGNKIKSVKKIDKPYVNDPTLPKGMWIFSKDAESLISLMKNKLPAKIVRV
ncbi:MAG: hypothetical protein ACOCV8_05600 [Spirochaetota bacterium]